MKYVMLRAEMPQKDTLPVEIPIIFPDFMVHEHVAEAARRILTRKIQTYDYTHGIVLE